MNMDTLKGQWKQLTGKVKEKWGKLTDNDLAIVNGARDQLVGKIQEKYGYARERAESEVAEFEKVCRACDKDETPVPAGSSTKW
ncbi:MAG: CsbD family protein [Gemmatales bacterium]